MNPENKEIGIFKANRDEQGQWGSFHCLSEPTSKPLKTEQVIRRLEILGLTDQDAFMKEVLDMLEACLMDHGKLVNPPEKSHNWTLFTDLMLATWIRRFRQTSEPANRIAKTWAGIINKAYESGEYKKETYHAAYQGAFGEGIYGGIFLDVANFYHVSLVRGLIDPDKEKVFLEDLLAHKQGIYYYGYQKPLIDLPEVFDSKQTIKYLACLRDLLSYQGAKEKLVFVKAWLDDNRLEDGTWLMSSKVKDQIYLPLSDSWRDPKVRHKDITCFVQSVYSRL